MQDYVLECQLAAAISEIGRLKEALFEIDRIGENEDVVSPLTARCIMIARRALAAGQAEEP